MFRQLLVIALLLPTLALASDSRRRVWNSVLEDVTTKLHTSGKLVGLCPTLDDCVAAIRALPEDHTQVRLQDILSALMTRFHPESTPAQREIESLGLVNWLHQKYGINNEPVLHPLTPGNSGTYRSPGQIRYQTRGARLPRVFDPKAESSIQDIEQYVGRKWGGLESVASPERILFSELGTSDTIEALGRAGYTEFLQVNGPYAMRGSKTLLAFKSPESEPTLVFYSFVGRDLLHHKLMQLAIHFGERFSQVQLLTSDSLKSWEVADLVVMQALSSLPETRIDDLVIGYTDEISADLQRYGKLVDSVRVGEFATVKYFAVTGKSGITRTLALLTDVELRYFGRSALSLVRPFLERGISRVIFAGSAGCFDRSVPLHSLVFPRRFVNLSDDGRIEDAVEIHNELFGLLPYGESYAGTHISVQSPLVESRDLVGKLRDQEQMFSVDVEGSKIAALIAQHNRTRGTQIRYAAGFIVTDTPTAKGDAADSSYGLHNPQYAKKTEAKRKYVSSLRLLWDVPGAFRPSNHTRMISTYLGRQIHDLLQRRDMVSLAILYGEIEQRIRVIENNLRHDRRASNGILKAYRDLVRVLQRNGITPFSPEYNHSSFPLSTPIPKLSQDLQKSLMLQSLSRSSTASSGQVAFKTELTAEKLRAMAATNLERSVDYIVDLAENKPELALTAGKINGIHRLINVGILKPTDLGRVRDFNYVHADGSMKSSAEAFSEYIEWLQKTPPSPAAALEAYLRFEQLHPYVDGNGRVAELIAQHVMLRATGHPFVFPNRFDIEYVLSLRRNGSFPASTRRFLDSLIGRSVELSTWILNQGVYGHVALKTYYLPRARIDLEREERDFISSLDELVPGNDRLVQHHAQYDLIFEIDPCRSALH